MTGKSVDAKSERDTDTQTQKDRDKEDERYRMRKECTLTEIQGESSGDRKEEKIDSERDIGNEILPCIR